MVRGAPRNFFNALRPAAVGPRDGEGASQDEPMILAVNKL